MKKLIFLIVLMLVPALAFGQIIITGGGGSSPLVIGGRIAVSSPGGLLIASGSVTRANTKISAVDGTAFVDFSTAGVLTNYAPKSKLTLTDSAGKKLVGYIKAAGTGETLGSELVTNGDMENGDPPSDWTADGDTVLSSVTDSRPDSAGTKSINIEAGGLVGQAVQYITLSTNALVKATAWRKNIDGAGAGMYIFNIISALSYSSSTSWNEQTLYVTKTTANNVAIRHPAGPTAGKHVRFDDISVKQVLTPSTTGVTITSTADGTTYNWASKEAGFNYNDASGYSYTIERE